MEMKDLTAHERILMVLVGDEVDDDEEIEINEPRQLAGIHRLRFDDSITELIEQELIDHLANSQMHVGLTPRCNC